MRHFISLVAGVALGGVVAVSGPAMASDYREVPVKNGGTIRGKVVLKGPKPAPRVFPLVLYPFGPFCKRISDGKGNVILQEFLVSPDGRLQDAVVAVEGVKAGKPFPQVHFEMVAEDCMFHPADADRRESNIVSDDGRIRHEHPVVAVFQNHASLSIVNRDPIIHNGQVFQSEKGNIVLNFPLPVSTQSNGGPVHFSPGKRIAQLICGMHEFMQNWGFVVDNPYYAKTKRGGEFEINRLPPGTYKVTSWHPHLKAITREVTVRANETVTMNFEFDAETIKWPHYESQEKFRIGPEAHTHEDLSGDSKDRLIIE